MLLLLAKSIIKKSQKVGYLTVLVGYTVVNYHKNFKARDKHLMRSGPDRHPCPPSPNKYEERVVTSQSYGAKG